MNDRTDEFLAMQLMLARIKNLELMIYKNNTPSYNNMYNCHYGEGTLTVHGTTEYALVKAYLDSLIAKVSKLYPVMQAEYTVLRASLLDKINAVLMNKKYKAVGERNLDIFRDTYDAYEDLDVSTDVWIFLRYRQLVDAHAEIDNNILEFDLFIENSKTNKPNLSIV